MNAETIEALRQMIEFCREQGALEEDVNMVEEWLNGG